MPDILAEQSFLQVPYWIISLIYLFSGVSVFSIQKMSLYVRIPILVMLIAISSIAMHFYFSPHPQVEKQIIMEFANICLISLFLFTSAIYNIVEYYKEKK